MPTSPTTMSRGGTIMPTSSARASTSVGESADGGRLHEALALVADLREAGEGGDVLTSVVRAEQELSAGVEGGADVGLRAAAVATVGGGQGCWCQCGVHVGLLGSL
jgi:hypothetical protein